MSKFMSENYPWFNGVNGAFHHFVTHIESGRILTERVDTRFGEVLQIPDPVCLKYSRPWERVLLNSARDANPFFHLYEALWMLSGRNDVAPLSFYSSKIGDVASDDGHTFNGAYGRRWRATPRFGDSPPGDEGIDQFPELIRLLDEKKNTRRAVLQMWNVEEDLLKVHTTKDVCCNTAVYFALRKPDAIYNQAIGERTNYQYVLDITVTNRSNDLVWGCLGANFVHFSFLQEYLAGILGVGVGNYYQFTNNLHVYTKTWDPKAWIESVNLRGSNPFPVSLGYETFYPSVDDGHLQRCERMTFEAWGIACAHGIEDICDSPMYEEEYFALSTEEKLHVMKAYEKNYLHPLVGLFSGTVESFEEVHDSFLNTKSLQQIWFGLDSTPNGSTIKTTFDFDKVDKMPQFLRRVFVPMMLTWQLYKAGELQKALRYTVNIQMPDWRRAAQSWILKRIRSREEKSTETKKEGTNAE